FPKSAVKQVPQMSLPHTNHSPAARPRMSMVFCITFLSQKPASKVHIRTPPSIFSATLTSKPFGTMKESLLDSERFRLVCGTSVGKRFTYRDSDLASSRRAGVKKSQDVSGRESPEFRRFEAAVKKILT